MLVCEFTCMHMRPAGVVWVKSLGGLREKEREREGEKESKMRESNVSKEDGEEGHVEKPSWGTDLPLTYIPIPTTCCETQGPLWGISCSHLRKKPSHALFCAARSRTYIQVYNMRVTMNSISQGDPGTGRD